MSLCSNLSPLLGYGHKILSVTRREKEKRKTQNGCIFLGDGACLAFYSGIVFN